MRSLRHSAWGCVVMLQSTSALASKEAWGLAGLVPLILWTIGITVVAFIGCLTTGALLGAFKASRDGESVLHGLGRGLLKGLLWFVIGVAAVYAVLLALSALWIAFSFVYVYFINPDVGR